MLDFKAVSEKDFEKYNKYRAMDETNASEGVFMTMFIWNAYYNLEIAENGEFLFLRFNIKNKVPSYFFPVGKGDLSKAIDELSDYSRQRGEKLCFRLVSSENAEKLKKISGKKFNFIQTRDSFDYVYITEKMISLSGKKLHAKRNHLNYFLENYNFKYEKVTNQDILLRCREKALQLISLKTKNLNSFEKGAMEKYFDYFFEFKQTGAVLLVDGEIAAMSFGEKLCRDTALIQIELADENYRGAYQAINKLFCENEWSQFTYVNREEDMGLEGLRMAKMGYQPAVLVEKYYVEEEN